MTSQIDKLKSATNLPSFAHLLGYKPKTLAYIIYGIPETGKYFSFDIKKKGGGVRTINSPIPKLKELQRRLTKLLNNCLKEIDVLNGVGEKNKLSHGFVRKYSICSNASKHTNKKWVFNIDLEDFFKNINFGRVRGYFIKNKYFCLNETVATIIAQISCHKNELPQGAPTSPVISNLIGSILDIRIASLARNYRCTYSRYADDITLSTNKKEFPTAIGFPSPPNNHTKWSAGSELEKIIHHSRFKINNKKTRMLYCRSQQSVTGIVVNEKVNISNIYKICQIRLRLYSKRENTFYYEHA
ncbi:reverse transcriptase domain-containing protein [Segnochrobactraceae bacterium EtOH-i3]